MKRVRYLAAMPLLAAAGLLAASAEARPWSVRTVDDTGRASHLAVDVLPNGRVALVLQRRVGRRSRLEVRVAGRTRSLDVARHNFDRAAIDHDRRGRLVVTWTEPDGAGAVSTWIAGRGIEQIGAPGLIATELSLDVAADGHAVVAFGSYEAGVFVVRRSPGRDFSALEMLSRPQAGFGLAAGVASGGRAVVAWGQDRGIAVRASRNAGAFGPLYGVALHARAASLLVLRPLELAMTVDGRAVIATSTYETGPGPPSEDTPDVSRVEAFDWSPQRPGPSPARILSRRLGARGGAEILSRGREAIIAWTERPAEHGSARVLRTVFWTGRGPGRPHSYETHKLGLPVALAPAGQGAAHVFYRIRGGHWYTVRVTAPGLFRNTRQVTPADETVSLIDVAGSGRRAAAAWTVTRRPSKISVRVQVARPG